MERPRPGATGCHPLVIGRSITLADARPQLPQAQIGRVPVGGTLPQAHKIVMLLDPTKVHLFPSPDCPKPPRANFAPCPKEVAYLEPAVGVDRAEAGAAPGDPPVPPAFPVATPTAGRASPAVPQAHGARPRHPQGKTGAVAHQLKFLCEQPPWYHEVWGCPAPSPSWVAPLHGPFPMPAIGPRLPGHQPSPLPHQKMTRLGPASLECISGLKEA